MNSCTLSGIVCYIKERKFSTGKSVVNFTINNKETFTNKQGESFEVFASVYCEAWQAIGDAIMKAVVDGDIIEVKGNIKTNSYEREDGTKRKVTSIVVREFEHRNLNVSKNKHKKVEESSANPDDDDLPF